MLSFFRNLKSASLAKCEEAEAQLAESKELLAQARIRYSAARERLISRHQPLAEERKNSA